LAPKGCLIADQAIEREVGQIGQAQKQWVSSVIQPEFVYLRSMLLPQIEVLRVVRGHYRAPFHENLAAVEALLDLLIMIS
jgi:hypothetical protein